LYECSPCGTSPCSFSAGETMSDEVFDLIVGTPIENCQDGSTSPITSTSEGSITIGDTWSEQTDIGFQIPDLSVAEDVGWSHTKSEQWSQSITIIVQPGQMGVLVARIQYKRTNGTLNVGGSQGFPIVSNQPINVTSYSSEIVSCDSAFSANNSSPLNCTSSATWLKTDTLSTVPTIVFIFFVVSVLV